MEAILYIISIIGIMFIVWLVKKISNKTSPSSTSFSLSSPPSPDDTLLNGYTLRDYHQVGIPDSAIDLWGLDQPHAPDPYSSGFIIGDIADGKFDGKYNF
jgi:hypothetical protein